jgi:hypothetical protein
VKCKMAFASQQRGWCVLEFHRTNSVVTIKWFPRSPDQTVCDSFLWGYVKGRSYLPSLPATVDELQERITVAVNSVTPDMLQRAWSELDYRIDVFRDTRGGHIERV